MTRRAASVLLASLALASFGVGLRWAELTGIGAAGVALVAAVVLTHIRRPVARLSGPRATLRTTREHPLQLDLTVETSRRGASSLRLVVGELGSPRATLPLARSKALSQVLHVPVDTSQRGEFALGPYLLVHGDPWGAVRRVVGEVRGGTVLVHPRTRPLRRSPFSAALLAESEATSRHHGNDHFHALREYVLGDEPRTIHWRSTARAGRLVVRQEVAAASSGTAVVLDTDVTAYGSDHAFEPGLSADRFEAAVDLAASLAVSQVVSAERVHLLTTTLGGAVTTCEAGSTGALLDVLAVTRAVPPVECSPEDVPTLLRRARCSRVLLITGTPSQRTTQTTQALTRVARSTVVLRVGARNAGAMPGVSVIDVESVDDLG